jgi:hypothetical protein
MDQGIIVSFKLQYRRQWMLFIVQAYEANKDPNKTVTLLKAIQWTRVAWEQIVRITYTPLSLLFYIIYRGGSHLFHQKRIQALLHLLIPISTGYEPGAFPLRQITQI